MPRSFAIIPAAGRSQRMGSPKLLLPWGDSTVIESVLRAWRASRVDHVVAVVHPADRQLAAACRTAQAEVVVADPPPVDMKASVLTGLAWVAAQYAPDPHDAWLVAPADMPILHAAWIDALLASRRLTPNEIIVAGHQGNAGHPVLFAWPLAAEVGTLAENQGLKTLVERFGHRLVELASDVLTDMDTPADYQRLQARRDRAEPS